MVDWAGKSTIIQEELEQQYGFLGGSMEEWTKYLRRPDARPLWVFLEAHQVRAVAGVSAVPKKSGKLRKLLMAVSAIYVWEDVRPRSSYGLGGGGALTPRAEGGR